MEDLTQIKKDVRNKLSALRNRLDEEYRVSSDALLCDRVLSSKAYLKSNVVLAFYPIKSEPQILPIVYRAIVDGKKVAFPISNTKDCTLTFRYVSDVSELKKGAYSILEPSVDCEEYVGEGNVLCLVPALAFDKKGRRIGYGKGFYDRFLSEFNGIAMGLCYSPLLVDTLPYEDTDMPVDIIITEKEEITIYDGQQKQ